MSLSAQTPNQLQDFMASVIEPLMQQRYESLEYLMVLLLDVGKIEIDEKKLRREFGHGFNPLHQFYIDERTHSQLIGNLLHPTWAHGFGDKFLQAFLETIGIDRPDKGPWAVNTESANVDILLKREEPHSVVIIENKSNYAVDQPSQLYRYWHKLIYMPNQHNKKIDFSNPSTYELPAVKANYQLIYLVPDSTKQPSGHSLQRPAWIPRESDLPEALPKAFYLASFKGLIVPWLTACQQLVPATNARMRGYLDMYIDYWKTNSH